ncbi:MAG: nuclear transport factor 2 family protein [Sphingomonadales bacterium]|nr:nuclear transport factor 2 family protein [Sphingomonadales bacterium]
MEDTNRRSALGALFALGAAGAVAAGSEASAKPAGHMAHHGDMMKQVDMLCSRACIEEVLMAYARGNDRLDADLLRSCFWPESEHHHGGFKGKSIDFVNFALKILTNVKYTAHHISNVSITVDGDHALTECYYFAHHRRLKKDGGGAEEDAFFEGRYLDEFERRDGVWKIIKRRGLADYSPGAIAAEVPFANWPDGQHSLRAPDDDWYAMKAKFAAKKG